MHTARADGIRSGVRPPVPVIFDSFRPAAAWFTIALRTVRRSPIACPRGEERRPVARRSDGCSRFPQTWSRQMRRIHLKTVCLIVIALGCFGSAALAQPTRISVAQFSKDAKKVADLKAVITGMRKDSTADPMSEAYRTSLAYWANTHGYIGTGKHATSMKDYITDYRYPQCLQAYDPQTCATYYKHVVDIAVPSDGFSDDIWGTCQHGNLFFLPWHRFYLHFFERTLQKRMKDPNFALPYWNYFDNYDSGRKGIALPPLVKDAANPLFDQWRTPSLNEGKVLMDPDSADASQAFAFTTFTQFSNQLQGQPHGAMHCAVGSGCVMPDIGLVPIAGADPVFYMHHSNIDRLWQCWLVRQSRGQPITLAWARANLGMPDSWYAQSYLFVDENGKPVKVTVADVFSEKYAPKYDQLQNCGARPASKRAAVFAKAAGSESPLKAHQPRVEDTPVKLGNDTVDVALEPLMAAGESVADASEDASGHTYLVLEDVRLVGVPSLTYKVYVTNKSDPDSKSSYVSTFSFFGTGPAHGDHADHGDPDSLGDLVYQVSGNLAELGIKSADDIGVRFVPTNLMIGQKLKAQPEGSGVTVGKIRLQTSDEVPTE
jgi:hypothetical protein